MDKKTKKRLDVLQQKITKLQRLLAAEKENLSSEVQKHKNETAAMNR